MFTQCFTWSEADFTWIGSEYTWNEVCLAVAVTDTGRPGGLPSLSSYEKLPRKEKDKFITLLLKIKNTDDIIQKKRKRSYKVTAKDVELVVNTVLKPNLEVQIG